uniref:Uncharacterized protein n=1 Tax=Peronospora matthiolae TaxID=2874970 RepID=A0AAV1TKW6_9STRA
MSPPSLPSPEREQELEARAPPASSSYGADSCPAGARGEAIHQQRVVQPDSGKYDEEATQEGERRNVTAAEDLSALQRLSAEQSGAIGSSKSLSPTSRALMAHSKRGRDPKWRKQVRTKLHQVWIAQGWQIHGRPLQDGSQVNDLYHQPRCLERWLRTWQSHRM